MSSAAPARDRGVLLAFSGGLFACVFALRFVLGRPEDGLAFLYVIPIAIVAMAYGRRAGLGAGLLAFVLFLAWDAAEQPSITAVGHAARAAVFLATGALVGHVAGRLRAATEEARVLVEAAPDAIVQVGADGRIVLANRQVQKLFGYRADELIGQTVDVLVPERFRDRHAGHRAGYESTPRTRPMGKDLELSGRRKDGSEIPVEISLSPARTSRGTLVTAIIRDVTDRRRTERQLRDAARHFEVARDLLCTTDAGGRLLQLNGSWQVALGWSHEQLMSRPITQIVHADDRSETARMLDRLAREGGTADFSVRIATRDGQWRWIDWLASGDPDGGQVFASARDVTERRAIETELGLHSEIVATMAEGVVLVGAGDRRIVYANPRVEDLFGYPPGGLDGNPLSALLAGPPQLADDLTGDIEQESARGSVWRGETLNRRADGSRFSCSAQVSQFDDPEHGRLWVMVLADVTERKRVEEQREEVTRELMRSNAELEQFAYSASHDLSEPLRVISGFAGLLSRRYSEKLDGDGARFLDAIHSGVDGMQALIDALLAYSRVGRSSLERREVSASQLVRQALEALATLAEERGATVDVRELPVVSVEPNLMRQLFQNLLSNAMKFASERPPEIEVSAVREDGAWLFSVADNGPGIDPEESERVFDMFHRLHGRDVPGTGIGLAICKRIVERHGGRLWLQPRPGGGSVFGFTVPDGPGAPPRVSPPALAVAP